MDSKGKAFPPELLLQSKKNRFNYFATKVLGHDRLLDVDNQLMNTILYPTGVSLVLVYGPTGVGKTTLRSRIEKKILELEMEVMLKDPGYLPVVSMEALATSRNYDWREHITRLLTATKEPLIDHKINPNAGKTPVRKELTRSVHISESVLRRSLESCFHQRRVKIVVIDEAQHLNKFGSGRNARDQMDTIKSFAETTNTIHILIGTYELLELTDVSAQLCKRSKYVHFERYSNHDETDQIAFASILESFQRHLPLAHTPDLLSSEDFFYAKTFGCIGVLKTMLNNALSLALQSEDEILTKDMLEESAPPLRDLVRMSREIAEGEKVLRETEEQVLEIKNFLMGVPPEKKKKEKDKETADVQEQPTSGTLPEMAEDQTAEQPAPKSKRRRPGERLPKRDAVGRSQKIG